MVGFSCYYRQRKKEGRPLSLLLCQRKGDIQKFFPQEIFAKEVAYDTSFFILERRKIV